MLWFSLALSFVTGILFGLIPAIRGSRLDLVSAIKSQTEAPARGGRWTLGLDLRDMLVTGQVAVSLVALIGAGLFLRSLHEAQRLNPGFRTEGLAVMFVNVGAQGCSPQRGVQFFGDALERVRQLPGVDSASWSEAVPQFSGQAASRRLFPEGRELPQELRSLFVPFNGIWPGYLRPWGSRFSKAVTSTTPIAKGPSSLPSSTRPRPGCSGRARTPSASDSSIV